MADEKTELKEAVKTDFAGRIAADLRIQRFEKKIEKGTAAQADVIPYAKHIAAAAAGAMENVLADTVLDWDTALTVLMPLFREAHGLVCAAMTAVIENQYTKQKIGIKAVAPDFPEERFRAILAACITASETEKASGD